jgi:3-deoxy-D-manno-octulosonic acid (KDO) 8-phosphate synthase
MLGGVDDVFIKSSTILQLDGVGVASGGLREMIPCIARTCVAVGVDGIFMEVQNVVYLSCLCYYSFHLKISC